MYHDDEEEYDKYDMNDNDREDDEDAGDHDDEDDDDNDHLSAHSNPFTGCKSMPSCSKRKILETYDHTQVFLRQIIRNNSALTSALLWHNGHI